MWQVVTRLDKIMHAAASGQDSLVCTQMGEIFLNEQPYFYEIILQFSFLYRDKHFLHQSSYRPENKWQKCEGLQLNDL